MVIKTSTIPGQSCPVRLLFVADDVNEVTPPLLRLKIPPDAHPKAKWSVLKLDDDCRGKFSFFEHNRSALSLLYLHALL